MNGKNGLKEGFEIIKVYNNMILYGNGNCLCNILFVKKNNRGYLYGNGWENYDLGERKLNLLMEMEF